ncbi:HAD-IIA family hydrolase [Thermofilum sp.]|uniref:HAD-IIA family hydrolase n=1 Tax=Thermofilum sp. TaxID=1961369 RepID=UPI0031628380
MSKQYNLCKCKAFVFDMDGTLILGNMALPCAKSTLRYLKAQGIKFKIITNNSSIPNNLHSKKLTKILNINITDSEILSSLDHVAKFLISNSLQNGVYPLLTSKSQEYLSNNYGIKFVFSKPNIILVGFDKELTYRKLERACRFVQNGVPWVLVHPDIRCPTAKGFIPDAGSIGKVIELTTGVKPIFTAGKPSKDFLLLVAEEFGINITQICYVGDRLYTDVKMALESKATPILLLSGETRENDLRTLEHATLRKLNVFRDLCELLAAIRGCYRYSHKNTLYFRSTFSNTR